MARTQINCGLWGLGTDVIITWFAKQIYHSRYGRVDWLWKLLYYANDLYKQYLSYKNAQLELYLIEDIQKYSDT